MHRSRQQPTPTLFFSYYLVALFFLHHPTNVTSYNILQTPPSASTTTSLSENPRATPTHKIGSNSRRNFVRNLTQKSCYLSILTITPAAILASSPSNASAAQSAPDTTQNDLQTLRDASDALKSLIENWSRATVDCTYADVPRELLEQKNKAELLEKASTFALFDKSTSIVSCKRSNKIVRDYIGATGKGPLVGLEKKMLRKGVVGTLDPDLLDDYFADVESFSRAISKASSFSYTAGTADFDSMNNFSKSDEEDENKNSNLNQAKGAIIEAKTSLDSALQLLSAAAAV